jgi:hypothetical protein
MEATLESAFKWAGLKLGGGLMFIVAIIGIRVVTAIPAGVESEIAELEALESEIAAESVSAGRRVEPKVDPKEMPPVEDDSLASRLGATVRERLSGPKEAGPDVDRLVSCSLANGIHFMRAADCATRGGRSTDFD